MGGIYPPFRVPKPSPQPEPEDLARFEGEGGPPAPIKDDDAA